MKTITFKPLRTILAILLFLSFIASARADYDLNKSFLYSCSKVFEPVDFLNSNQYVSTKTQEAERNELVIFFDDISIDSFKDLSSGITTNENLLEAVYKSAKKYDVNPFIVLSIIWKESSFNRNAENNNAFGFMQITLYAVKDFVEKTYNSFSDSFKSNEERKISDRIKETNTNIEVGTFYLKQSLDRNNNDIHLALMEYNGGQGYVSKRVKKGKKSSSYSERIVEFFETNF